MREHDKNTEFDPSGRRAEAVAGRMRERLADSLRYIASSAAGVLALPPGWDGFLARLAAGPVSPLVFGAYCDLVLALESDALDEAAALLAEIAAAPSFAAGPLVGELGDPRRDRAANRYRRLVDTDPTMPFTICPPPREAADRARALIAQAFALIDAGNPALAAEIRVIVREIVIATGSREPGAVEFDGVSSFLLWGGVVLNAESYATALDMVQALAHESGHNLLFGLCADGPLHENDDAERFASPLRADPRPIDGIVHAAYVSARMHQSVQRLIDARILDAEEARAAAAANLANAKRFAIGIATVDENARLTPLGRSVMDGARAYMASYI